MAEPQGNGAASAAAGGAALGSLPQPRLLALRKDVYEKMLTIVELAGQRELQTVGLAADVVWDASRPDVQRIARERTKQLFDSVFQTAGDRARVALADELSKPQDPFQLAEALRARLGGVSKRQAEMAVRSEVRDLYNEATLDAWELAGMTHVRASDGHGGLTGRTDADCVARNGRVYTIKQARLENHSEVTHPRCTLGWQPIVPKGGLRPDLAASFDPALHPRAPAHTHEGGEFVKKVLPSIHPDLLGLVNGWHGDGTRPWDRPKADFVAGRVPGFEYRGDGRGVAARMPAGSNTIEVFDGAFTGGGLDSLLVYHEVGHNVSIGLLNRGPGLQEGSPVWKALEPWYHPTEGYQGKVNHRWRNPWLNPYGETPSYSDNPEEIIAEAYAQLVHGDLERRTTFTPGIDGPPGGEFTPEEVAAQQKWRDLYALVAATADEMGLPSQRLWMVTRGPNGEFLTIPSIIRGDGAPRESTPEPQSPIDTGYEPLALPSGSLVSQEAEHVITQGQQPDRYASEQAKRDVATALAARLRDDPEWDPQALLDVVIQEQGWSALMKPLAHVMGLPVEHIRYLDAEKLDALRAERQDEMAVAYLVNQWATSADQGNPPSDAMQLAVSTEFGIPTSPTVNEHLAYQRRSSPRFQSEEYQLSAQRFARAQYEETQAYLAKHGLTSFTLYRGIRLDGGVQDGGQTLDVASNPMSSWSSEPFTAIDFGFAEAKYSGDGDFHPDHHPTVLVADVPVSRVIATPRTGMGCLKEFEFVLLGGNDTVFAYSDRATARTEGAIWQEIKRLLS